jgi:hypothetical protein
MAVATGVALALALVREEASFAERMSTACYIVGCLVLLLAFAGHSPTQRHGTIDPWLASFAIRLLPWMQQRYAKSSLSDSALLALTGLVMLALGVLFDT